jgi:NitT/TauT family transport system permease protein
VENPLAEYAAGRTGLGGRLRGLAGSDLAGRLALYAVSVLGTLAIWQYLSDNFLVKSLFPSPAVTARAAWELVTSAETPLWRDVGATCLRILAGFLAGSAVGVLAGMLMGAFAPVRSLLTPYVQFLRFVPPLAWLGPAVLWFGAGEETRIILVTYTTLFVVAINTMAGAASIPRDQVRMARAFGASRLQVFRRITVPGTVSYALTGMRLAMGNSFMTVVTAEMLGAEEGLGYILHSGRMFYRTDLIFVAIVLLGLLGLLADRLFQLVVIQKLAGKYQPGHR